MDDNYIASTVSEREATSQKMMVILASGSPFMKFISECLLPSRIGKTRMSRLRSSLQKQAVKSTKHRKRLCSRSLMPISQPVCYIGRRVDVLNHPSCDHKPRSFCIQTNAKESDVQLSLGELYLMRTGNGSWIMYSERGHLG